MFVLCEKVEQLCQLSGDELVSEMDERIKNDPKLKNIFIKGEDDRQSERESWRNSLPRLFGVLHECGLDQLYAVMEYSVPKNPSRIDVVLLGIGSDREIYATVVELKQWSKILEDPGLVKTKVKICISNREVERRHPCAQLEEYVNDLQKNHTGVLEHGIKINCLAYLHNFKDKAQLFSNQYAGYKTEFEAKTFVAGEERELKKLLNTIYINEDIGNEKRDYFLNGDFNSPDEDFDNLETYLDGDSVKKLVNKQRDAYEEIMDAIKEMDNLDKEDPDRYRLIVVVSGAAGTGKSVLGLSVLSSYYNDHGRKSRGIYYTTHNQTLRAVLLSNIAKSENKSFIRPYKGIVDDDKENRLLVVDEAQRMEKADKDQKDLQDLQDLIKRNKILVLLQDDNQIKRIVEEGTCENIKLTIEDFVGSGENISDEQYHACKDNHLLKFINPHLTRRLRNGDGSTYGDMLDDFLSDKEPRKYDGLFADFEVKFEVKVEENLKDAEEDLKKNLKGGNRCKWLAPFCWSWTRDTKNNDIDFGDNGSFQHPWNPVWKKDDPFVQARWYKNMETDSFNQVGCVYTCQGLQFDYVGLIVWDDLVWTGKKWKADISKNKDYGFKEEILNYFNVNSIRDLKDNDIDKITTLVINTYRILFTRATKGIFIWFKDTATRERFMQFFGS